MPYVQRLNKDNDLIIRTKTSILRLAALVNNGRCISLAATYCVNGRCCHSSLAGACGLPFDMNGNNPTNSVGCFVTGFVVEICYGIWGLDRCLHLEVDSFMFRLW
ncbi:hypothetical protein BDE02_03G139100 [Populus trichocarpa]|nr:hypothetical protein BDE02_03G139100 [Populus trichocarpa]